MEKDEGEPETSSQEVAVLEVVCKQGTNTRQYHVCWLEPLNPEMSTAHGEKKGCIRKSTFQEYALLRESDSSSDDDEVWTERSPILREGGESEIIEIHMDDEKTQEDPVKTISDDNLVAIPAVWRIIQGVLIILVIGLVSFLLIHFIKRPWEDSPPVEHHDIHIT